MVGRRKWALTGGRGVRVLNRLNTDTPPGPPSVESIQVREPIAGQTGGQLANFESSRPQTIPAAKRVTPRIEAAVPQVPATAA